MFRAPLSAKLTKDREELEKECKAYMDSEIAHLPAMTTKLDQI